MTRSEHKRNDFVKKVINNKGISVEVGVLRGVFSSHILATNPKELHLIDCWKLFPDDVFPDYRKMTQRDWDNMHDKVVRKFSSNKNVKIVRAMSLDAVSEYADNSLDFVYIDANHEYSFVLEDLTHWLPKVKRGGWIGGHDWNLSGVKRAVEEVFGNLRGEVIITAEPTIPSYFYRKV